MKRAISSVLRALAGLVRQPGNANSLERARRRDLMEAAAKAQRDGATHGKRWGPAVAFYRSQDGRIETCFTEYHTPSGRYTWIWEPPDWREAPSGIPQGATEVSEIARRGI